MKSIFFLLIIPILSFANTLNNIENNNLEIAKQEFVKGNYQKSYDDLKILFLNNPSNYEINYALAKAATKIRKFGMASASYDRILINEPNSFEIKFEQAKLLYLMGNIDASIISLNKLLSENLSINLSKSIKKYLISIKKEKKSFFLDTTFLFSLNYNSNVNNAPEEKYILQEFDYLGVQGRDKVSDTNHLEYINFDITKKLEDTENISFKNNFTYFIKTYLDEKDENFEFYSYKPALSITDDSDKYYLGAMFERYQPKYKTSEDYFDSVGLETIFYNKNFLINIKAKRTFFRNIDKKDKNYSRYQGKFRTLNKNGFNFSSTFTKDLVFKTTRTDINKISIDNNFWYSFKLNNSMVLKPSLQYKMTNYKDSSIAFNTKRKDRVGKYSLELKKFIDKSSFVSIEASYFNNKSNQEEYDYKNKTIGLLYVKKFRW